MRRPLFAPGCRKTPQKTDETEQRGVCAGGKKPTARSIKQDFETFFESFKIRTAWRKDFFDTLGVDLRSTRAAKRPQTKKGCSRSCILFSLIPSISGLAQQVEHVLLVGLHAGLVEGVDPGHVARDAAGKLEEVDE